MFGTAAPGKLGLVWCSVITLNYFRAFCADAALLVVAIALL